MSSEPTPAGAPEATSGAAGAVSPTTPEARLGLVLGHVRRALGRAAAREGLVYALAGLAAAVVVGAMVSGAGGSVTAIALGELLVAAGGVALALARFGRFFGRAARAPSALARWFDAALRRRGLVPAEQTGLLSAVELSAARGRFGESTALGDAAIALATDAALSVDSAALVKGETWSDLRRGLLWLVGVLAVLGGTAAARPAHVGAALAAVAALGRMEVPLRPLAPEPRLGDFRITYRYPAYSERPAESGTSLDGALRALPGTEVTIETSARDDLARGALVLGFGSGGEGAEEQRIACEVSGRHLKATLVLSRAGRYRFSLETESGQTQEERRGHAIELELDEPPEIAQLSPEESPLEVNEKDRLSFAFEAQDDYGLGDVYFAWRVIGSTREGKEKLTAGARGSKRWAGSAPLELAGLGLRPGDRVAYSLEARDNDTVNGPKVGASTARELRIYSKSSHHEQVLALEEQTVDELVHILGDNLEGLLEAKGEASAHAQLLDANARAVERALASNELLSKTVAAIRKDPLGRPQVADAFEAARTRLLQDTRRQKSALASADRAFRAAQRAEKGALQGARAAQDLTVAGLEKNVVYLADLLNEQRMIDAEALTKELREAQQQLKRALEEYRRSPDPEKRRQLMTAIQEIKQRIADIMKQLAKTKGSIPQDFVNKDALETQASEASMDEVARKIEEGDLDGAMKELDGLLGQTEKMISQLQEGRQEMGSREYSEVQETAERMFEELKLVEREQRELASKTEKLSREVEGRMQQRLGDPAAFIEKQRRRLDQVSEALARARPGSRVADGDAHEQAERRVDDARRALEARDFGAAKEMVESAAELMEQLEQEAGRRAEQSKRFGDPFSGRDGAEKAEKELRRARPVAEEVLRDIDRLMPPPESLLSEEERQQLQRQRDRQGALEQRAKQIGQDLERVGQELPIVGPEMKGMVSEAAGAMGEAGRRMTQGDAPGALGQQRRAAEALGRLRQELEKMGEGQGSQGGGGVPLPFGQSRDQGGGEERGQGRDDPRAKVEIPKPEQFKAPTEFRQDILEAAKQGTVEDYREAVRRYYEELVK